MARKKKQTTKTTESVVDVVDNTTIQEEDSSMASDSPVFPLEEESTESNTQVPLEEETSVIDVQEDTGASEEVDTLEEPLDEPASPMITVNGVEEEAIQIVVKTFNLNELVDKVLLASFLGGDRDTSVRLQLDRLPFRVGIILPKSKLGKYNTIENGSKVDDLVKDASTPIEMTVSGINSSVFIDRLFEVGVVGARVADKRKVVRTPRCTANLILFSPLQTAQHLRFSGVKPKFTIEQLKTFTARDLKVVCEWYKIPFRGKSQSRIDLFEEMKK